MSELTSNTKIVLKLNLGDIGGTRRIHLNRLWEDDTVSYGVLRKMALQLNQNNSNDVVVTYEDEDGDEITISSNEELSEAFCQFIDKVPPVLRATANFTYSKNKANAEPPEFQDQTLKVMDTFNAKNNLSDDNKNSTSVDRTVEKEELPQDEQEEEQMTKEVISNMKVPAQETTNGDNLQQAPNDCKPPAKKSLVIKDVPNYFDREFIHGRYTCDGCGMKPIIGIRFHAKNHSNSDLCQNCFKKIADESSTIFEPTQSDRDINLQNKWKRRQQRFVNHSGHRKHHRNKLTQHEQVKFRKKSNNYSFPRKSEM